MRIQERLEMLAAYGKASKIGDCHRMVDLKDATDIPVDTFPVYGEVYRVCDILHQELLHIHIYEDGVAEALEPNGNMAGGEDVVDAIIENIEDCILVGV